MTPSRIATRTIAMLFGLVLLAGLGTPARAIDPYPGETREAFVARSALEQQRKLAEADAAAGALAPGLASGDSDAGGIGGGALGFGMFGVVSLALGAMRLSRGIFRASQAVTRTGNMIGRKSESFEARLAEKLRELERTGPAAQPLQSHAAEAPAQPEPPSFGQIPPAPRPAPGPRTFGRRVG